MIDMLERAIRSRWPELGLEGPPPTSLQIHLDSGDPREHGFVHFRALRSGDTVPFCVGRIPRDGVATRVTLHEQDLLLALEREAPRATGRLFPRPLFTIEQGARVATARTVIPGSSALTRYERISDREHRISFAMTMGERWLAAFGRSTGLLEGTEAALWEPALRSLHFERRRVSSEDQKGLDSLERAIESRRAGVVLCGFGHGAFALPVLRIAGDRIGVVDWEHGRTRQAPWTDPVHFALDVALREAPTPGDAASYVLDATHPIGIFARRRLEDVGVPENVLPLAIPAVALEAAHRIERDGPTTISADAWRDAALASSRVGRTPWSGIGFFSR